MTQAFFRGPGQGLKHYTKPLAEAVRFQLSYLTWSAHDPSRHPRYTDSELNRAAAFLMMVRWEETEQRTEIDAARAAIEQVRSETLELLDVASQTYVVDERRVSMIEAAKRENAWTGKALQLGEAQLTHEYEAEADPRWPQRFWQRSGYRQRGLQLQKEIDAGSGGIEQEPAAFRVSLESRLRRTVGEWRRRGLLPPAP